MSSNRKEPNPASFTQKARNPPGLPGDLRDTLSPEGRGQSGCGATGRASVGERERSGKGAFSPQCAEQIGTSSG